MTEHEEFLEEKDFKRSKIILYGDTLAKTNGHPKGDGEVLSRTTEGNVIPIFDDEVIAVMPNGQKIYKSEDPGEMYKMGRDQIKKEKVNILLEETPIKDRRYLKKGVTIERKKTDGQKYRRGYTQDELIAKRLPESKTVKGEKNFLYMVLNTVNYGYTDRKGEWNPFVTEPGETFYAPMKSEDNEKREKILNRKK